MATTEIMRVKSWLQCFDVALRNGDINAAVDMFEEEECFWRDLVSFTWNIETAESRQEICAMLNATLHKTKPCNWEIVGDVEIHNNLVQSFVSFETERGRGKGIVKLKGDKCWCLLTTLQELKGFEEKPGPTRDMDALLGAVEGRKAWLEGGLAEKQELGKQPYCLIVGGGQAGITLGVRLQRLGVPTIIVEKNKRAGDSWRRRYECLHVHSPVRHNQMPYIPFPDHWPEFASKDKIGDWLEAYTVATEVVYWASTECKGAQYDKEEQRWEVKVVRNETEEILLYPTQLVLATGIFGEPNIPIFPGARDQFEGAQCHASEFRGAEAWVGKQCVVIGSSNSAHDICAHLWESGAASVTMVQRSATHVFPVKSLLLALTKGGRIDQREEDLLLAASPYKVVGREQKIVAERVEEENRELYKGLEEVGFMHTFGDDGSGLLPLALRRAAGFYVDVGASKLVIGRQIKLKSRVHVAALKEKSVVLSDGSELPADLIVYATGYAPMQQCIASLLSHHVANTIGPCWGLGSSTTGDPGPWQRELRNMWKPTLQPNLWIHGGGFPHVRPYSLYLALQIKARFEHIPTPMFRFPPPL